MGYQITSPLLAGVICRVPQSTAQGMEGDVCPHCVGSRWRGAWRSFSFSAPLSCVGKTRESCPKRQPRLSSMGDLVLLLSGVIPPLVQAPLPEQPQTLCSPTFSMSWVGSDPMP